MAGWMAEDASSAWHGIGAASERSFRASSSGPRPDFNAFFAVKLGGTKESSKFSYADPAE